MQQSRPAAAPGGGVGEALRELRALGEGFALLRRERALWPLALVPVGFSALALVVAGALLLGYADEIDRSIEALWPVLEAGRWYAWLWVGPARAFFWLLGVLVFLLVAALAAVVALVVATVAASPFLDALSSRVERLQLGHVVESEASGVRALLGEVARTVSGELRRMAFFLAITGVLFGVGFVVPGAHVVTGPLMVGVTILFLPLEYSGHVLDRRQVPVAARRRWIVARWPRMAGFGAGAFVLCCVPFVNLLVIPGLVVAGTLLAVADPPAETPVGS